MIKDKRIAFALYVILFVVFWNILDILYMTFVSGTGYTAGKGFDIDTPLLLGLVTGYLFFIAKSVNINDELEEARNTDGAVIVDVRSEDEYAQGHIPGAVNVPLDDIDRISEMIEDTNTPLFTYCLTGSRSSRAVKTLKSKGFTHVINMGGINKYKGKTEQ